jgi:nucleoside-diphosphate-sugar epimerase
MSAAASSEQRPILVTGALGNVGREVLRALVADGRRVVATDLRNKATVRAAREFEDDVELRWADLTSDAAVHSLVSDVAPRTVLHLAAVIPPATYTAPTVARAVNVGASGHLVDAVGQLEHPCRLVLASSVAVYGSRNPHTVGGPATSATPPRPREQYGAHKVEAERLLRESGLDWTVLRIGVVVFADMALTMDEASMRLEALLPADGRLHAVDGRDVGRAFAATVDADCSGRTLLIAGDDTTRMTQQDLARSITAAVGLRGALPPGRPGDPSDDDAWFNVDWMDTAEAQSLLDFQHHSWDRTLHDLARNVGPVRHVLPLARPVARRVLARRSPYRGVPDGPADPWGGIARVWGDAALVTPESRP